MFKITTSTDRDSTIEGLIAEYPLLYAADESGFEIDPEDIRDDPELVVDSGYGSRWSRRILFWANQEESVNDPGINSIAEARWEE